MSRKIVKTLSKPSQFDTMVQLVVTSSGQQYVIKRIKHLETPIYQTIFQKETQALLRLKACKNIVRIYNSEIREYDAGHIEGIISMEYIPGKPLSHIIESIPNISIRYQLVRQLTNAIRYAHFNSVIHRDINPSNILVTDDYELKLIDFGIAKIRGMLQVGTTYQFATQNYSAPEVTIHSENASERSDIYSLGAVIYNLFTGNAPPSANEIIGVIGGAGGIDVTLKDILCKMCAPEPANRYENIDDCDIALTELYQRYCGCNEHYYFAVPTERLEQLKAQNLVSRNITYASILNNFLPSQFMGGFVNTPSIEAPVYRFDGVSISMECVQNSGIFHVTSFRRLDAYKREQRRKFSLELPGQFDFFYSHVISSTSIKNNFNEILCNRINDFQHDISSQKNIDREYDNQYGIWRQFIQAMIQNASQNAARILYSNVNIENGTVLFKLAGDDIPDDNFSQETTFVIERTAERNKKTKLIEIGSFLEYRDDGTTLAVKSSPRRPQLPPKGSICVDYRKEIQQYQRQEAALEEFRRSETNNTGNLKGILVGAESPGCFQLLQSPHYFNQQLDITQKRAVRKILEANDIALIQGPPGTGKTNVLIEVIRQILAENEKNPAKNQKILIVSQSHAAVDKILKDLSPFIIESATTIRIGSEDNIEEDVNTFYGLNHCQELWAKQSVKLCSQKLHELLVTHNIPFETFLKYAQAKESLRVSNLPQNEVECLETIVSDFELTYKKAYNTTYIQQCLIMDQWCRHLLESDELGEYYIKNATIVAGTCSGFISDPYVRNMVFDYVIIDEAAKATFPEIMVSLVKAYRVILVGDHLQLPPIFDREALKRNAHEIKISQLRNTGFGKLFELLPDNCKETLSTQYRMHPCIGELISLVFYDGKVQNGVSAADRKIELPMLQNYAITWISTSLAGNNRFEQLQIGHNMRSYVNPMEVTVIQQCLSRIDQEIGIINVTYSIGVITPYRAQLELIQNRLKHTEFRNIKVDINTVDAFQGSQRDIIIYSTVRSSSSKSIGFLREQARLNVSFSRAQRTLIIIGDSNFLNNPHIPENLFPSVQKYIQTHPEQCRFISSEDFSSCYLDGKRN
ncbi:serine/threonine-protein kinase [Papillibacter cinnamivorans]|nr:serine/threonine-protein kinase [Papillibacter cinnamivorans]